MSPARAVATERPLRDRTIRERTTTGRVPHPSRGTAVPRSPADVDALVTEHLPLAAFAVNAVASRISLPAHVRSEEHTSELQSR